MLGRIWVGVLSLMCAGIVHADTVVMQNGDRLSGTIDSIISGEVLIATEYAGLVRVQMDAVASIESEAAFDIDMGGQTVSGTLAVVDGVQSLVGESSSAPIALAMADKRSVATPMAARA